MIRFLGSRPEVSADRGCDRADAQTDNVSLLGSKSDRNSYLEDLHKDRHTTHVDAEQHVVLSARLIREHLAAYPREIDERTLEIRTSVLMGSLQPAEQRQVFSIIGELSSQAGDWRVASNGQAWLAARFGS